MLRKSPYYINVRQMVFSEINQQLSQELDSIQKFQDFGGSTNKKSVSKQDFNSIFYKKINDKEDENVDDQVIKKCSNCEIKIISDEIFCQDCNKLICQKCINECNFCGSHCCKICSKFAYLQNGDFVLCLYCTQQQ